MAEKQDYRMLKKQLDDILEWFENGDVDVDEAVKKYEEGKKLITKLEDYLKTAENKIEKIKEA